MRYTRYIIGGLLIYITISTYFWAIANFYPDNYFSLFQTTIPITVLDFALLWTYSKGNSIYGTNDKQRGRWILIVLLMFSTVIALVYSFIQKTEVEIQKDICIERAEKVELYKSKLDTCMTNK